VIEMFQNIHFPNISNLIVGTTLCYFGVKIGISTIKGFIIWSTWRLEPAKIPQDVISRQFSKESIIENIEEQKIRPFGELFSELILIRKQKKMKKE